MSKSNNGRKPAAKRTAKAAASLHEQGGRFLPLIPVADLWYSNLDSRPVNYSWGYDETSGYGEKWQSHEASRCEECGAIVVGGGEETHAEATASEDEPSECAGYIPGASGPMMSYYYPIEVRDDFDPQDAARKLVDLPVCVIEWLEDEQDSRGFYALALTGGGTDLTWEICEAFMRLGYLPPVHFAGQLPEICGRGALSSGGKRGKTMSPRDTWIVEGCRRSLRGMKERVGRALRKLREDFPTGSTEEAATQGEE